MVGFQQRLSYVEEACCVLNSLPIEGRETSLQWKYSGTLVTTLVI